MKIKTEKKLRETIRKSLMNKEFSTKKLQEEETEDEEEVEDTPTEETDDLEGEDFGETDDLEGEDFGETGDETGGGDSSTVLQNLEQALEGARSLGDEKLINQIGNTITFFTRAHIVKTQDEMVGEDTIELDEEKIRWNKIAGI